MNILVTGGTGFIGIPLTEQLARVHDVFVWCRHPERVTVGATAVTELDAIGDTPIDAIINLAGEPIADGRWTDQRKAAIRDSRLGTTDALGRWLATRDRAPSVFISGSAIGYYGLENGGASVTESDGGDASFSSTLCRDWEAAAQAACPPETRLCLLRTGIVLGDGGALAKMRLPFSLGLGGPVGSGQQWMPWIHLDDICPLITFLLEDERASGPVNATAPQPVTNRQFASALGRALNRPAFLPMPAFAVKALFGQMGEELLLNGRKVLPATATALGFPFQYESVDAALQDVLGR